MEASSSKKALRRQRSGDKFTSGIKKSYFGTGCERGFIDFSIVTESAPVLPRWLPIGWQIVPDSASDFVWIVYTLQCAGLMWWLYPSTKPLLKKNLMQPPLIEFQPAIKCREMTPTPSLGH